MITALKLNMMRCVTFLCMFLVGTQLVVCKYTCPPSSDATSIKRLNSNLFCDYDPQERPVKDRKNAVKVHVWLHVKHIAFVDFQNKLEISTYVFTSWYDEFLRWNPLDYENISSLNVPASQMWCPDTVALHSAMQQTELYNQISCKLSSSGVVTCLPHTTTEVYCNQNLTPWPYDKHTCNLTITSYTYQLNELEFALYEMGHSDHLEYKNNGWELLKIKAIITNHTQYSKWSELIFTFELQRHAYLYVTTVIAPAFVFAALTLVSFWLHGVATRACVCCSSLLGNAIFLLYIGFRVVASGDTTPDIAFYYRDAMILTVVALVIATSVERARELKVKFKAPKWLVDGATWLRGCGGRPGQFLLGEEDVQPTQENPSEQKYVQCSNFLNLIDRSTFLVLCITYTITLVDLLP